MQIDLHDKALNLLNMLANSIHDRNPNTLAPFFFSTNEIQLVEDWLRHFANQVVSPQKEGKND